MSTIPITINEPCRFKATYGDAVEGRWSGGILTAVLPTKGLHKVAILDNDDSTRILFADRVQVQRDGRWVTMWRDGGMGIEGGRVADAAVGAGAGAPATPASAPQRLCTSCQSPIPPTGKRGRPASKCNPCRGL